MKKLLNLLLSAVALLAFSACNQNVPLDMYESGTSKYETTDFSITAKGETDRIYVESDSKIYLISKVDVDTLNADGSKPAAPEYTITGTFNGQIVNKTKATVLNLSDATLTNTNAPAIYGEKKIELSAKKNKINTITVTGDSTEKVAAVYCEKAIEIGGSGTLKISGNIFHGIKGGDIKVKGSGNFTIDSGKNSPLPDGSAINCDTFLVEADKSFTLTLTNYKHGIKADETIDIASGNINIDKVEVGMKTETIATDPEKEHHINITGGSLKLNDDITTKFVTDEGKLSVADGVIIQA